MLRGERRDVLEQGGIDSLGFPKQSEGAFQIDRVPQCDGGDHQVETAGTILLILEGTVSDLAQPIERQSWRLGLGVYPAQSRYAIFGGGLRPRRWSLSTASGRLASTMIKANIPSSLIFGVSVTIWLCD